MTKDEAQRRSVDPDSAGRWTFYEAVIGGKGGAIPMSAGAVFLIRVGLGVLFGFLMMKMFYPRGGILAAGIITVFLVGMAYLLAHLRQRRQEEERRK
jgi:hypothetical protein